jgi:hypothetical protein
MDEATYKELSFLNKVVDFSTKFSAQESDFLPEKVCS